MKDLTEKQASILAWIRSYMEENGCPPTVRDIAGAFGFRSPRAASDHLEALERKGCITREAGTARGLRLTGADGLPGAGEIPIVGDVAAGLPILAVEHMAGTLSFDSSFGGGPLFAVRVRGDSMIEHGILDGDHVIVRRSPVVPDNTIAVAYIEGEATVKTIRKNREGYVLIPGNPAYEPVQVTDETQGFAIAGPVVGVVRSLKTAGS